MTTHLVTFASPDMDRSQKLCYLSAIRNGVHQAHLCDPASVRRLPYYEQHRSLFDAPRGAGYWAWKPALLNQIMTEDAFVQNVRKDHLIIYADVGIEFIAPVSHITDRMGHDRPQDDIWLFGNNWEHAHWCKRDVIEAVWPTFANAPMGRPWNAVADSATWTRFGKQVQASLVLFRVSNYSRAFVAEWLKWCLFEGGRLIDDSPSRLPNHPEFQEHRHDQAILTTLAYREGIPLHYWPAIYNLGLPLPRGGFVYEKLACYAKDDYPSPLFHHHRRRNHEWGNVA